MSHFFASKKAPHYKVLIWHHHLTSWILILHEPLTEKVQYSVIYISTTAIDNAGSLDNTFSPLKSSLSCKKLLNCLILLSQGLILLLQGLLFLPQHLNLLTHCLIFLLYLSLQIMQPVEKCVDVVHSIITINFCIDIFWSHANSRHGKSLTGSRTI